ncbi:MAG: hypothetical protein KAT05_16540 [Spirochaetes bacterium]|nr:hypothetical protein [Spirochaetota bacterium]
MKAKELSKKLSSFEGICLPGFFMMNPAMITAASLLFDKIYLPNQLELIIDLSKKYKITTNKRIEMKFERMVSKNENIIENPLKHLSSSQQRTVQEYLRLVRLFCIKHHELFPTVFQTDLFKSNKVLDVKLIKEGIKGKLNTYSVEPNSLQVTTEDLHSLENKLRNGSVPLISSSQLNLNTEKIGKISDSSIAALLAMQSIEMLLPSTKGVRPEVILEARERLCDYLPQFWSVMLKFSKDGKNIIQNSKTTEEITQECKNLVDTTIRPVLIDLNEKIIKEKKNWFYKILSPIGGSMKLIVGKPNLTNLDLLTASTSLATRVGTDYVDHKRKLNELKDEAGLTYLIELGKHIK